MHISQSSGLLVLLYLFPPLKYSSRDFMGNRDRMMNNSMEESVHIGAIVIYGTL